MLSPIHEGGKKIIPPLNSVNELHLALLSRAPEWALCGPTPQQAGCESSRRPAEYALEQRFCQLNPRNRIGVIVIDCDHQNGLNLLDAPPPTYTTMNPESGHQQPGYVLADPVSYGGAARRAPQQLLESIRYALTKEQNGDPHFAGLISRGPFHPKHITRIVSGKVWSLNDLLDSLPPLPSVRHQAQAASLNAQIEGRNPAMFDELRYMAYELKAQGVQGQNLLRQLREHATVLNKAAFSDHEEGRLSERELHGIVKSISNWVDRKYRRSAGSTRSRQHSRDRQGLSEEEQLSRRQTGQAKTAQNRRDSTRKRLEEAERQLEGRVTAAALVKAAGVSRSTALRYLRETRE